MTKTELQEHLFNARNTINRLQKRYDESEQYGYQMNFTCSDLRGRLEQMDYRNKMLTVLCIILGIMLLAMIYTKLV